MARRYHEIKGLAEFTARMIVSSEEDWKKFLHAAGHMYILPCVAMTLFRDHDTSREGFKSGAIPMWVKYLSSHLQNLIVIRICGSKVI